MPSAPATGDTTARTVDERFLDLICSDAGLLAAEFDAIITAEWSKPPANRPGRGAAGGHATGGAVRRAADPVHGPACRPRPPGIGEWARQRSPPPAGAAAYDKQERQVIATRESAFTR